MTPTPVIYTQVRVNVIDPDNNIDLLDGLSLDIELDAILKIDSSFHLTEWILKINGSNYEEGQSPAVDNIIKKVQEKFLEFLKFSKTEDYDFSGYLTRIGEIITNDWRKYRLE